MNFSIEGNHSMPALKGGYLIIKVAEKELCVVSVPSLNLGADNYKERVNENSDYIEDENGNTFNISVSSSNFGVDWDLIIATENDKLKELVDVEYQSSEY